MARNYAISNVRTLAEEIRERGYTCAVFCEPNGYRVIRARWDGGRETNSFQRRSEQDRHSLIGVYTPDEAKVGRLREDIAAMQAEAA